MRKVCLILAVILATGFCLPFALAENEDETIIMETNPVVITFGRFEQDGNPENGPEPIEWLIVEDRDNQLLLLSRYGLAAAPYNTERKDVTWEDCSLRAWLNGEFLDLAFSGDEQEQILLSDIRNGTISLDAASGVTGGNDTRDKVFLLSFSELVRYSRNYNPEYNIEYVDYSKRICGVTPYAMMNHSWTSSRCEIDGRPAGIWLLRTTGDRQDTAVQVSDQGDIGNDFVDKDFTAVRPAIWVELTEDASGDGGSQGEQ